MRVLDIAVALFALLAGGCLLLADLDALEGSPVGSEAGVSHAHDGGSEDAGVDAARDVRDVEVPPPDAPAAVFRCSDVDAAFCDDYERANNLIGPWSSFHQDPGTTIEIRDAEREGRYLFLGFPGGDGGPLDPIAATYLRWDTPASVGSVAWEADVFFASYPTDVRRVVDLIMDTPGQPRVALIVRPESGGAVGLLLQYPAADGGIIYDERTPITKLVSGVKAHIRVSIEPDQDAGMHSAFSIDGVPAVDVPLPPVFVPGVAAVYQGSVYQVTQAPWSIQYDGTVVRTTAP